ncbi:penicillin-binding protein 2 [Rhizobium sp. P44RR-XXIV]|uniref:peptidoglycan D,D-transpeptidase FtsI family protein n=1 Tax=Rhizobium sp. P44RR-XXIV TaxID=1921145 RepID=UPI0009861981|nr:penicillin-binding protein 2 [Rhizobium sp. P44RR-XXIV]TIX93112.1 penicillin-binding protein 2 [Rhizobium sp. P44RR-XXIV]
MTLLSQLIARKRKVHFRASVLPGNLVLRADKGGGQQRRQARSRTRIIIGVFLVLYAIIGGRLVQYALSRNEAVSAILQSDRLMASRPDIVDRNGELLATDINTVSLFAEPNRIIDPDEAIEKLATVIPDLDRRDTYHKLSAKGGRFAWLRRQLTPRQQSDILALGVPGIGFRPEKKRFYPGGPTASHILGYVDIDNRGVSGMERYIDEQGFADLKSAGLTNNQPLESLKLSIDNRVQNIVRDVVVNAVANYQAKAAGAVILDVNTGEVLAMASAPDFDPNNPLGGAKDGWLNRMSNGTFEMGSTFKTFSLALALDTGKVKLTDSFDATQPLRIGGFTINDFHGQRRWLTLPEVFEFSSNIGTARIVDVVGMETQRKYMTDFGLLTRLQTELPEVKSPSQPKEWKKINSITISFGHGVATTPLQTAVAGAALVNGGRLMNPTFLLHRREQAAAARLVVKPSTSDDVRYLFKLNGVKGSGRNADVAGFNVGGKTGTADKVVNGRYANNLNFNAFLAAFPIEKPQFVVLTFCDEPKNGEQGQNIAAYTAAPMVRDIVSRAAPLLGVEPSFGEGGAAMLQSY